MSQSSPATNSAGPSTAPISTRAKKRHKANVTKACAICRRKRIRCDGMPQCSKCVTSNKECVYDSGQDGRKPASKAYVAALLNRIEALEESLRSRDSPTADPPPVQATGGLKLENDVLTHHGPSSAYMHLPDGPPRSTLSSHIPNPFPVPYASDITFFHWLPKGVITSNELHEQLLNVFFSHLAGWCYWTDEAAFRSGLGHTIDQPSCFSSLFHNVILALAVQLAPESVVPSAGKSSMFDALGSKALACVYEGGIKPNISYVKGLMLLGTYCWAIGRHSLGWAYEGMGVRMAQSLGLNTDCSDLVRQGVISEAEQRDRDHCLWTVYIQDQLWGLAVGRTSGFTIDDVEITIPEIDPLADAVPYVGSDRPAWTSSVFHYTCKLAISADRIHQALYRITPRHQDHSLRAIISELHLDLNAWLVDLPSPLRVETGILPPNVTNMHVVFRYLQILLHRPTYTQPHSDQDSRQALAVETCTTAATEINKLLLAYKQAPGLQYATTTMTNATFTAGTIHLLSATLAPPKSRAHERAMGQTQTCIDSFEAMSWPAAKTAGVILRGLVDEWTGAPAEEEARTTGLRYADLKDPESEVGKMLTDLGWQPPTQSPSQGFEDLNVFNLPAALRDFLGPIERW